MVQGWRCSFPFEVHPTDGLLPQPEVGSAFPLRQGGAEVFQDCSLQKLMGERVHLMWWETGVSVTPRLSRQAQEAEAWGWVACSECESSPSFCLVSFSRVTKLSGFEFAWDCEGPSPTKVFKAQNKLLARDSQILTHLCLPPGPFTDRSQEQSGCCLGHWRVLIMRCSGSCSEGYFRKYKTLLYG